jgi:hypothetical protein
MKRFVYIMCGLFFTGLAVTVALRMTTDAMAVIVGIILGMIATVPTTLVLLFMIRQRDNQQQMDHRQQQYGSGHYPPVVVVNSPPNQLGSYTNGATNFSHPQSLPAPMGERSFKVVGHEPTPSETLGDAFGINIPWEDNN